MNFEEHDLKKSLDCFEQTISRNMDFNDFASKDSEVRNTGEKTHTSLENT